MPKQMALNSTVFSISGRPTVASGGESGVSITLSERSTERPRLDLTDH